MTKEKKRSKKKEGIIARILNGKALRDERVTNNFGLFLLIILSLLHL